MVRPIATYAYTYDANGNRTIQRVTQGGAEEVTTYAYDTADRFWPSSTQTSRQPTLTMRPAIV